MATGRFGGFSSGGELGMGVAFYLEDHFSRVAAIIENRMNRLESGVGRMSDFIGNSMSMIRTSILTVVTALGLLGPYIRAAKVDAEFEKYRVSLETFLGSAQEANRVFAEIRQKAVDTPGFGVAELMRANQALISQGIEADRSMRIVQNLANVLAGAGRGNEELMRMAINLQQIAANGKATAIDIRQFGYAGVNIMGLYEKALGKTAAQMGKVKGSSNQIAMTLEDIELALDHASSKQGQYYGALDRIAATPAGKIERVKESIKMALADIGKAIRPITSYILDTVSEIITKIQAFVATPFGQQVARWGLVLSILIVSLVTLSLVMKGFTSLLMGAVMWTGRLTKGQYEQIIASNGLITKFMQLSRAAWASLGPYVLIAVAIAALVVGFYQLGKAIVTGSEDARKFATAIAFLMGPIGWTAAAIAYLIKGFKTFNSHVNSFSVSEKTGILGFFTKLGGFIQTSLEVLKTWNGKTFELTESTVNKLKNLGIYEQALGLATWVVRVVEFFKGVWQGLKEFATGVYIVVRWLYNNVLSPIYDRLNEIFDKIGFALDKNESELSKWARAGKVAAYTIGGAIFLAMLPLMTLGAIIAIVFGSWIIAMMLAYKTIKKIITVVADVATAVYNAYMNIHNYFVWLWDQFVDFIDRAALLGRMLLKAIWQGIKDMWNEFADWLTKKMEALFTALNPMKWMFGDVQGQNPRDYSTPGVDNTGTFVPVPVAAQYSNQTSKTINYNRTQVADNGTQPTPQPINLVSQVVLDGSVIYEQIQEIHDFNQSRNA